MGHAFARRLHGACVCMQGMRIVPHCAARAAACIVWGCHGCLWAFWTAASNGGLLSTAHAHEPLQVPALSIRKPALFEQCLELLFELAASPDTGEATTASMSTVSCYALGLTGDSEHRLHALKVAYWGRHRHVQSADRSLVAGRMLVLVLALHLLGACAAPSCGCRQADPRRFLAGPAGVATLDLLRGYYSMLVPLLDSVACAPLPEGPWPRASSLHQRAWLLQVRHSP